MLKTPRLQDWASDVAWRNGKGVDTIHFFFFLTDYPKAALRNSAANFPQVCRRARLDPSKLPWHFA
jgi:hypothetical protein